MRLIRKGKVKDIYELDDGNVLFHFSDRVSAFDVNMATPIPRKGEVLCRFGEFWFDALDTPHHMLRIQDRDKMVVKKLQMIPMECVVRGYFYGSLQERYKDHLGKSLPADYKPILAGKLPRPIFDPTTKSEEHDVPVDKKQAIDMGLVSKQDYEYLEKTSISLYEKMSKIADEGGFIIADVKFEFGHDSTGKILLGDSLGPDEYRLWLKKDYQPGKTQEAYDKQHLRDWLIRTGFKTKVDGLAKEGKKPDPPEVAQEIVSELALRYIFAYEKISGKKL
ncbi:MAG TPA: phosphoribosylaminoimidazolesuccinocarboxamide synthase [Nitrososphaera sp.]